MAAIGISAVLATSSNFADATAGKYRFGKA